MACIPCQRKKYNESKHNHNSCYKITNSQLLEFQVEPINIRVVGKLSSLL